MSADAFVETVWLGIQATPEVLLYHLLPVTSYALLARRVALPWRIVSPTLYVCAALGLGAVLPGFLSRLAVMATTLGYYLLLGLLVHRVRPLVAAGALRGDTLFSWLLLAFLFVPALVGGTQLPPLLLGLGVHYSLASYSYCQDAPVGPVGSSLGDCLFFLFVNPALVYAERGTYLGPLAPRPWALRRVVVGAAWVTVGAIVYVQIPALESALSGKSGGDLYLQLMATALLMFLGTFVLRSGVASFDIGLLGILGYRVPECYDRPLLATSPADFWRRWNMYFGAWARRYMFTPWSLALLRWRRRTGFTRFGGASKAVALVATFVAVGLLHDARRLVDDRTLSLQFASTFALASIVLLGWEAASRLSHDPTPGAGRHFMRVPMLHYIAMITVLARGIVSLT